MDHYEKLNKFKYVFIDSHPFSEMNEMRYRTHIFPESDGKIRPILFFDNPKYKKWKLIATPSKSVFNLVMLLMESLIRIFCI